MSRDYEIQEYMHNSIYIDNIKRNPYSERKRKIFFSEPDTGVNEHTGILLLIAGFGANSNSNVYKKMREKLSDNYNLITIQCDYFGYEFMQNTINIDTSELSMERLNKYFPKDEVKKIYNENNLDFNKLIDVGKNYNISLCVKEDLSGESLKNFNDMGIMQALDNIVAILKVMSIIYENGYQFNTKKVILYGHSHGSFLGYLCNRFCPGLFSHFIDNSSWLYPNYLINNRYLPYYIENMILNIEFEYLSKRIKLNSKVLDLNFLYSNFENNCEITCYHGVTDNLITHIEKRNFCRKIKKCTYNEITEEKLDGEIFKSTNHGLDADFLKLFDYSIKRMNFEEDTILNLPQQVIINTDEKKYCIDYENILPLFTIN